MIFNKINIYKNIMNKRKREDYYELDDTDDICSLSVNELATIYRIPFDILIKKNTEERLHFINRFISHINNIVISNDSEIIQAYNYHQNLKFCK